MKKFACMPSFFTKADGNTYRQTEAKTPSEENITEGGVKAEDIFADTPSGESTAKTAYPPENEDYRQFLDLFGEGEDGEAGGEISPLSPKNGKGEKPSPTPSRFSPKPMLDIMYRHQMAAKRINAPCQPR